MKFIATLLSSLTLAGLSWADCVGADSETLPSASRQILRDTGYRHYRAGQYQKAIACYVDALRAGEASDSHNSAAIANDLNDIAILSEEMGRYADARRY